MSALVGRPYYTHPFVRFKAPSNQSSHAGGAIWGEFVFVLTYFVSYQIFSNCWSIRTTAVKMRRLTTNLIQTPAAFLRRKLYFAPHYFMRKLG